MYFEDLTNYTYDLPFFLNEVKCIGWLEKGYKFEQKPLSIFHFEKLKSIYCGNDLVDSIANQARGYHYCDFCNEDDPKFLCETINRFKWLGSNEIWIPSVIDNSYYAAPSLIIHYIEKHSYSPPQEYLDAVLNFNLNVKFNAQEVSNKLMKQYSNLDLK